MKTKNQTINYTISGAVCAGALLLASSVSAQNLFVSDSTGLSVDEYTPNGTPSTFATGLNYPDGLAFNSAGDLFVADTEVNTGVGYISEITPNGTQSIFYNETDPMALAFNGAGNLFAADYATGDIYEYTPGGVQSTFATGFNNPISMTIDSAGDLFVGSGYGSGSGIITKITPNGTQSVFATGLNYPGGLTFNNSGDLLVTSQSSATIYQYTPGGVQSVFATVNGASTLNSLVFNGSGDLFVGTAFGGDVVEITPNGTQSTFATGLGNAAGLAFQPVPEPSSFALLGIGAAAFFARRRR